MIRVEFMVVGPVSTNCYFVINDETKEALIVDPGEGAEGIGRYLSEHDLKPVAILLTHGHFDHTMAAGKLRECYGIKVYACHREKELLNHAGLNLAKAFLRTEYTLDADVYCMDGEVLSLLGREIQVLETPGHTTGGCCYYFPADNIIFTGDTLFCRSIGRTDFPGGSYQQICESIKQKLFVLPKETLCYTGHGESTTIGHEKERNPYVR